MRSRTLSKYIRRTQRRHAKGYAYFNTHASDRITAAGSKTLNMSLKRTIRHSNRGGTSTIFLRNKPGYSGSSLMFGTFGRSGQTSGGIYTPGSSKFRRGSPSLRSMSLRNDGRAGVVTNRSYKEVHAKGFSIGKNARNVTGYKRGTVFSATYHVHGTRVTDMSTGQTYSGMRYHRSSSSPLGNNSILHRYARVGGYKIKQVQHGYLGMSGAKRAIARTAGIAAVTGSLGYAAAKALEKRGHYDKKKQSHRNQQGPRLTRQQRQAAARKRRRVKGRFA